MILYSVSLVRCVIILNIFVKLLESEWPLSIEETDAILDFAPISSQFFKPIQYEDPNEHLAIPGPSTRVSQVGTGTQVNISFILK